MRQEDYDLEANMGYKEKPLINQLIKRLHTSGDVQRQKAFTFVRLYSFPNTKTIKVGK